MTEAPPVVFPAVSQHGHHEQPTAPSQGQWPGHTQAVGTPTHSASDHFPAPEDDAADWFNNQGPASSSQEPQSLPLTASQGYESAGQQQPQAQPAWNFTNTVCTCFSIFPMTSDKTAACPLLTIQLSLKLCNSACTTGM